MTLNKTKLQNTCYWCIRAFGLTALVALVVLKIATVLAPALGMGYIFIMWGAVLCINVSLAVVSLSLILLFISRPLSHPSLLANVLAIAGLTFVVAGGVYAGLAFGLAMAGINTNTPIWAFASYCFKVGILLGLIQMHFAFVASYRPLRLPAIRLIAAIWVVTTAGFILMAITDTLNSSIYQTFALLAGIAAFVATIATINLSQPKPTATRGSS